MIRRSSLPSSVDPYCTTFLYWPSHRSHPAYLAHISFNLPFDMADSPHWAWNNLGNGLTGNEVAEVQILFFEGRAPIDIYRAIYYGAAGESQK